MATASLITVQSNPFSLVGVIDGVPAFRPQRRFQEVRSVRRVRPPSPAQRLWASLCVRLCVFGLGLLLCGGTLALPFPPVTTPPLLANAVQPTLPPAKLLSKETEKRVAAASTPSSMSHQEKKGKQPIPLKEPKKQAAPQGMASPLAHLQVSSHFGWRSHHRHDGVDLAAPAGTPIRAAASGVVQFAGWQRGYGRIVILSHTDQPQWNESRYAHCHRLLVRRGQSVSAGEVIAKVGSTGRSTGPHLHFELRQGGQPLNPEVSLAGKSQPAS